MSQKALIQKTLTHEVNRDNGIGEEVFYTHAKSREAETVKCFPQEIVNGEESRDKISDYVVFYTLILDEQPSNGDTIVWGGRRYNYEKTVSRVSATTYNVKASVKRHTGGRAR